MDSVVEKFLERHPSHKYKKKQVLLRPEQEEDQVFFIKSGFVRAHTITEEGNEFSAVLLGPGMYFPVFRYLLDITYTKKQATKYFYSGVTDVSVTAINTTVLTDFLLSDKQIASRMTDMYYANTKFLLSKLEFMVYTHSAYKKVCYMLMHLAKKFGKKVGNVIEIEPDFTHKEFATFVGLSRESVSHQLSLLHKRGVLLAFHPVIRIASGGLLERELAR